MASMRAMIGDMVTRQQNGYQRLADCLRELGDVPASVAMPLARWYVKHKLAKIDVHCGQFTVRHGAYLERDVIQRALATLTDGKE